MVKDRIKYEQYAFTDVRPQSEPWKHKTKQRAAQLVELACRCKREGRNEPGWRFKLEDQVFLRFDYEIACRTCRCRLWRADFEAPAKNTDAASVALDKRQKGREPCKCPLSSRTEDSFDAGLSRLFSDRAEETIHHDEPLKKELPKRERPDRVFGLQCTSNFQLALQAARQHFIPSDAGQTLRASPFPDDGTDPLIFPFLIVEAKSGKGPDSFDSIEVQTAFSIQALLEIQRRLQGSVNPDHHLPGGPLVWFFSYKGEDWRVYAGYVDAQGQSPCYHVLHLWSGCITSHNDALQLLLIVDYIFDWARDVYRPNILSQIRALSTSGGDPVLPNEDPDIFSTVDCAGVELWNSRPASEADDAPVDLSRDLDSEIDRGALTSHPLDSRWGYLCDGRRIDTRFIGIYITGSNARTLLQSLETAEKARKFAGSLLHVFSRTQRDRQNKAWRTTELQSEEMLNALEDKWTGNPRQGLGPSSSEVIFMQLRFSYYITVQWEAVREMNYLAVSEDGIRALVEASGRTARGLSSLQKHVARAELEHLLFHCDTLLRRSAEEDLKAAFARETLAFQHEDFHTASSSFGRQDIPTRTVDPRTFSSRNTTRSVPAYYKSLAKNDNYNMQDIVHFIYNSHKIGRREPSEPFIRHSSRQDITEPASNSDSDLVLSASPALTGYPSMLCLFCFREGLPDLSAAALRTELEAALKREEISVTELQGKYTRRGRKGRRNIKTPIPINQLNRRDFVPRTRNVRGDIQEWIKELIPNEEKAATVRSKRSPSIIIIDDDPGQVTISDTPERATFSSAMSEPAKTGLDPITQEHVVDRTTGAASPAIALQRQSPCQLYSSTPGPAPISQVDPRLFNLRSSAPLSSRSVDIQGSPQPPSDLSDSNSSSPSSSRPVSTEPSLKRQMVDPIATQPRKRSRLGDHSDEFDTTPEPMRETI